MVKIDSILCLKQEKPDPVNQHPVLAATAGQSATKSTRLPKLILKKFNGETYQWQSFWDSFSSSVDTNESLSDVEKFNYLRNLCEQGAASTIAGLALTDANYKVAVDLLKKRFGNVDVVINSHMDRLLKLPQLNNSNDVRKLRVLYDSIEAHVRGLQALDVTSESYGKLVVPILLSKLPEGIRLIISRQKKEETWSLDNLLEALKEEITAREMCAVNSKLSTEERRSSTKQPATASALFSIDKKGPNCTYCRKSHPSSNCPNVTNIAARKQILKTSGRCFNCLKKNHLARNCASNGHCFKCSGKHHVSLCQQNNTQPTFPTPFRKPEEKIESQAESKEGEAEVSDQNYVGVNGGVLLQTARAGLASHEEPHGV